MGKRKRVRPRKNKTNDGGSMTPNAHSSSMISLTDSRELKRLSQNFIRMKSILENDERTLQLLQALNQNDVQGADDAKSEKMATDNENDDYSSVNIRCGSILRRILSTNVDIIKNCSFSCTKTCSECARSARSWKTDDENDDYSSVRMRYGSILRRIISAHGDIIKDCSFSCTKTRSHFLKRVCHICKKLEVSNIFNIDAFTFSAICQELVDLQKANVNVKWLQNKVDQIIELAEEVPKLNVAGMIEWKHDLLKCYENELELYKGKVASLEKLVKEEEEELNSMKKKIKILGQSFLHGVL